MTAETGPRLELVLLAAAKEDVDVPVAGEDIEEVNTENLASFSGAGAWNFLPLGWSQSTSPVEFTPQHCHKDVVGLYTMSGCGWSPTSSISGQGIDGKAFLQHLTAIHCAIFQTVIRTASSVIP